MKLIIAGTRTIGGERGRQLVRAALAASGWAEYVAEIVHGGAHGIDSAAHDVAEGVWPVRVFPADWKRHGRAAGPIRNQEMAEYGDALLAVWDGKSRGTKNMIETMRAMGKPVYIHEVR